MTSLIFGVALIIIAVMVLRMPRDKFRRELDELTGGRKHTENYYKLMRGSMWALAVLGAAMIVLRFF